MRWKKLKYHVKEWYVQLKGTVQWQTGFIKYNGHEVFPEEVIFEQRSEWWIKPKESAFQAKRATIALKVPGVLPSPARRLLAWSALWWRRVVKGDGGK